MARAHHAAGWQQPTLPDIHPADDGERVWAADDEKFTDVIALARPVDPTAPGLNPPTGETP